ncbi:hypothetical protein SK128_021007 [Halocaridina rubra]|uniref:Uncharacterized protein n=1 Tax=Halocaridina rubra TaxID=373956 RepID=A0AAN8WPJ6_HALRR
MVTRAKGSLCHGQRITSTMPSPVISTFNRIKSLDTSEQIVRELKEILGLCDYEFSVLPSVFCIYLCSQERAPCS